MEINEAKEKFLQAWGSLGSSWGINRTMAQVHALLLVSENPLTTEEIMNELGISRGNANMNIRALLDWGLVARKSKAGERKELFTAEKDIWKVSKLVARERHKRELEPALKILEELQQLKDNTREGKEFKKIIGEIHNYTQMVDSMLQKFIQSNNNWLTRLFTRMLK